MAQTTVATKKPSRIDWHGLPTGKLPFRGDTSGLVFNAILERSPVSAVRINPDIPRKQRYSRSSWAI